MPSTAAGALHRSSFTHRSPVMQGRESVSQRSPDPRRCLMPSPERGPPCPLGHPFPLAQNSVLRRRHTDSRPRGVVALPAASQAAGSLPCDIYAGAGTPCVAAHSTTRALFSSYNGPLYQVSAPRTAPPPTSACWPRAVTPTPRRRTPSARTPPVDHQDLRPDAAPQRPDGPGPAGSAGSGGPRRRRERDRRHGRRPQGIRHLDLPRRRLPLQRRGPRRRDQRRSPRAPTWWPAARTSAATAASTTATPRATPSDTGNGHMDAVSIATTCYFAAVHRIRPLGRGRHGERHVPGRQRLQHRQPRQQQRRSSPPC